MKWIEIRLQPRSSFGTEIRGDTLFGQIATQIAMAPELYAGGIEQFCADSLTDFTFSVSSAIYFNTKDQNYYFRRPRVPISRLFGRDQSNGSKEQKSYLWVKSNLLTQIKCSSPNSDYFAKDEITVAYISHRNSINRLAMSTSGAGHDPYQLGCFVIKADFQIALLVGINEAKIPNAKQWLTDRFTTLGQYGYGRDSSSGYGQFDVVGCTDAEVSEPSVTEFKYGYLTGPCIPPAEGAHDTEWIGESEVYVGRHGGAAGLSGRFVKAPLLMFSSGSVLRSDSTKVRVVGRCESGISNVHTGAIHLGVCPVIPLCLQH